MECFGGPWTQAGLVSSLGAQLRGGPRGRETADRRAVTAPAYTGCVQTLLSRAHSSDRPVWVQGPRRTRGETKWMPTRGSVPRQGPQGRSLSLYVCPSGTDDSPPSHTGRPLCGATPAGPRPPAPVASLRGHAAERGQRRRAFNFRDNGCSLRAPAGFLGGKSSRRQSPRPRHSPSWGAPGL